MDPLSNRPKVSADDVANGYVSRYFVRYVTSKKIVEVDKVQYFKFVKNPKYETLEIKWIIVGNDKDIVLKNGKILPGAATQNKNQLNIFEEKMSGISYMLTNPLEYFRGTYIKT